MSDVHQEACEIVAAEGWRAATEPVTVVRYGVARTYYGARSLARSGARWWACSTARDRIAGAYILVYGILLLRSIMSRGSSE